jgi:hypothetical protein
MGFEEVVGVSGGFGVPGFEAGFFLQGVRASMEPHSWMSFIRG